LSVIIENAVIHPHFWSAKIDATSSAVICSHIISNGKVGNCCNSVIAGCCSTIKVNTTTVLGSITHHNTVMYIIFSSNISYVYPSTITGSDIPINQATGKGETVAIFPPPSIEIDTAAGCRIIVSYSAVANGFDTLSKHSAAGCSPIIFYQARINNKRAENYISE
jgi:hypothetical protein